MHSITTGWTEKGYVNPPWSLIPQVLSKVCHDCCEIMLVLPEWPRADWYRLFRALETRTVLIKEPCYWGEKFQLRPKPKWDTRISILDGNRINQLSWDIKRFRRDSLPPTSPPCFPALPDAPRPDTTQQYWPRNYSLQRSGHMGITERQLLHPEDDLTRATHPLASDK